jgi:hypothetical protein
MDGDRGGQHRERSEKTGTPVFCRLPVSSLAVDTLQYGTGAHFAQLLCALGNRTDHAAWNHWTRLIVRHCC